MCTPWDGREGEVPTQPTLPSARGARPLVLQKGRGCSFQPVAGVSVLRTRWKCHIRRARHEAAHPVLIGAACLLSVCGEKSPSRAGFAALTEHNEDTQQRKYRPFAYFWGRDNAIRETSLLMNAI